VASYCVTSPELKESWIHPVPAHVDSSEFMADRAMSVPFLVIDDIGKEHRTNSGYSENNFGALLRYRVKTNRVTSLTSNLNPKVFGEVYGRSTQQLVKEAMSPIKIEGPDMREKVSLKIGSVLSG